VNRLFYKNTVEGAYASLFFAEYDDTSRRLRYVNCGHLCGLLLRGDDSIERLDSTTTLLGLFDEWDCSMQKCELAHGDTLTLYTDGITESVNSAGEQFEEERLIEALRRHRDLPAEASLEAILRAVQQFSSEDQYDDITLIVAKCL
jgi:serine phosphatase RsbU (regulator of sigma subunit)